MLSRLIRSLRVFTFVRPGSFVPSPTWVTGLTTVSIMKQAHDPRTTDLDAQRRESPEDQIRKLSWNEQTVSHGVWSTVRAASQRWYIELRNPDGTDVKNADKLKKQLMGLLQQNVYSPNSEGFSFSLSFDSVRNQMYRQVNLSGGVAAEAVVDKMRRPKFIRVVEAAKIFFKEKSEWEYVPYILDAQGREISLDRPNFFWARLDPDPATPDAISPIQPVLDMVYFFRKFVNALQEVAQKTAWPRISVKMLEEAYAKAAEEEALSPKELRERIELEKGKIAVAIQQATPGQVFVTGSHLEIGVIESKNQIRGTLDPAPLLDVLERHMAQAMKKYASVLGVQSKVDALQHYMEGQSIRGYQQTVEDIMSQILTFFLRLLGKNVVAFFRHVPFEMRPESELEPARSQKFATNSELVLWGVQSPEEFCLSMTGGPIPEGSKLHELFNRHDLIGMLRKQIPNSETDDPNSPARPVDSDDGRSDPDATRKRGKTPSATKTGEIKRTRRGTPRKPR